MINITTICFGSKYEPIKQHWKQRVIEKCSKSNIYIWDSSNIKQKDIPNNRGYAFWGM